MNNGFNDILNKRLGELPSHEPDMELWSVIEAWLETDEAISRRLQELPQYAPSVQTWEAIEAALPAGTVAGTLPGPLAGATAGTLTGSPASAAAGMPADSLTGSLAKSPARLSRRIINVAAAAAAAAILMLGIPRLMRSGNEMEVVSEFTVTEEYDGGTAHKSTEEDPLAVIENLCKTGVPVCQSEAFREKLQLCRELDVELRQLETVISQVGDSPEIIQAVIRIENLKSGTLQELIQMIHS